MTDFNEQIAECERVIRQNQLKARPFTRTIREQKRLIRNLQQQQHLEERINRSRSGGLERKCVVCIAEGGLLRIRYSTSDRCLKHFERIKCASDGCEITAWHIGDGYCYTHSPKKPRCRIEGCRQGAIKALGVCHNHRSA